MLAGNPKAIRGMVKAIDRVNSYGANVLRFGGVAALLAPLGLVQVADPDSEIGKAIAEYSNDLENGRTANAVHSASAVVENSGITDGSLKVLLYD